MKTINPGRFLIANGDLRTRGGRVVELDSGQTRTPGMIPGGTRGKVTEVRGDKVKVCMELARGDVRECSIWVERYMIGQLFRNR